MSKLRTFAETDIVRKAHGRARASYVCHCGIPKRRGFTFCLDCYNRLPMHLQTGLKMGDPEERDDAFIQGCAFMGHEAHLQTALHPVMLNEAQLDALFLAAHPNGKRVAVAALLEWARVEKPREYSIPTNRFEETLDITAMEA